MSDIELKEGTKELAKELKKHMKVGGEGVIEVNPDTYEKTLSEGLTMKQVERVQKHNQRFTSALGLAVGEMGLKVMKKDENLDQVSATVKAGGDDISAVFQRDRKVPDGQGGQQTKHGYLTANYRVQASGNKGELKKVRQHLQSEAEKVLGG